MKIIHLKPAASSHIEVLKDEPTERTATPASSDVHGLPNTIASAKKIQKNWRNHLARKENRVLNSNGLHEILHHNRTSLAGYSVPKNFLPQAGKRTTFALLPHLGEESKLSSKEKDLDQNKNLNGAVKAISHRLPGRVNDRVVYDEFIGLSANADQLAKPLSESFHLPKEALTKILELELSHVVAQHEINPGFYVVRAFKEDLFERMQHSPLPLAGFQKLLSNLKTLHVNNLVHRDIKPENMLVKENEAYLTDLDTVDFAHQIQVKKRLPGTIDYLSADLYEYLGNQLKQDQVEAARKSTTYVKAMDNYAALISIIEATEGTLLTESCVFNGRKFCVVPEASKEFIAYWIQQNAKKEFVEDIYHLVDDTQAYAEKHGGEPPHLVDMLKWN